MSERQNQSLQRKPLLYITQPNLKGVTINMQKSVVAKPTIEHRFAESKFKNIKAVTIDEVPKGETQRKQSDKREEAVNNVVENTTIDDIQKEHESNGNSFKRKPLKEMTVEEKIHFIINKPHYIPNMLCIVKTNSKTYLGSIVKHEEGIVTLHQQSSLTPLTLPVAEIKSIKMSGF